jgi:hypothetical protein
MRALNMPQVSVHRVSKRIPLVCNAVILRPFVGGVGPRSEGHPEDTAADARVKLTSFRSLRLRLLTLYGIHDATGSYSKPRPRACQWEDVK